MLNRKNVAASVLALSAFVAGCGGRTGLEDQNGKCVDAPEAQDIITSAQGELKGVFDTADEFIDDNSTIGYSAEDPYEDHNAISDPPHNSISLGLTNNKEVDCHEWDPNFLPPGEDYHFFQICSFSNHVVGGLYSGGVFLSLPGSLVPGVYPSPLFPADIQENLDQLSTLEFAGPKVLDGSHEKQGIFYMLDKTRECYYQNTFYEDGDRTITPLCYDTCAKLWDDTVEAIRKTIVKGKAKYKENMADQ